MPHTAKLTFSSLLCAEVLICVGYVAAQQNPSQQSKRTQSVKAQSAQAAPVQQDMQVRDRLAQLQMQVHDLQTAIDDLRSKQLLIGSTAEEAHQLVSDSRVVQAQERAELNSLAKTVGGEETQLDKLGQQVSRMLSDLQRVKSKVGLY